MCSLQGIVSRDLKVHGVHSPAKEVKWPTQWKPWCKPRECAWKQSVGCGRRAQDGVAIRIWGLWYLSWWQEKVREEDGRRGWGEALWAHVLWCTGTVESDLALETLSHTKTKQSIAHEKKKKQTKSRKKRVYILFPPINGLPCGVHRCVFSASTFVLTCRSRERDVWVRKMVSSGWGLLFLFYLVHCV